MDQDNQRTSWNWNTILRWIHLLFAMMISVYFGRITMFGETWSHEVTMFVGQIVMAIVFWKESSNGSCQKSKNGIAVVK